MFPIKIIQCPNHEKIQKKILKHIANHPRAYYIDHEGDPEDSGPWTDWNTQGEKDDKYFKVFRMHAENAILDVVREEMGGKTEGNLCNYWFQQYETNSEHGWHFHWGCLYHVIYYLELPEGTPATLVRAPGGFEFTPNVKEGDILIMPSIFEHTSPVNTTDERKTIIAVNVDNSEETSAY